PRRRSRDEAERPEPGDRARAQPGADRLQRPAQSATPKVLARIHRTDEADWDARRDERSPDLPVGRRSSGCGACRAEGGDEHGRERTRRCVTDRAQETTPGSAASAPEMLARAGGFGLQAATST